MFASYYYIYRTAFDFSKINVFTLNSLLFHVITFLVAVDVIIGITALFRVCFFYHRRRLRRCCSHPFSLNR